MIMLLEHILLEQHTVSEIINNNVRSQSNLTMRNLFMKQRLQQKLGKFLKMLKIKLKGNLNFVNLSICNKFLCVVVFLLNEM